MKSRAIVIWVVSIFVLGMMGALLFNQSNRNQEQLDQQASRNILLVREGLFHSEEALKTEVRSYITYQLILSSKTYSGLECKKNAAEQQNRDATKFKFEIQNTSPSIGEETIFGNSLKLQGFSLDQSIKELIQETDKEIPEIIKEYLDDDACRVWLPKDKYSELNNSLLAAIVPYEIWFKDWMDNKSFYDYLVLVTDSSKILYPDELKGTYILEQDKSLSSTFPRGNVNKFETHLTSEEYQGYITRLKNGNQNIWVAGLKKKSDLVRAAFRVDYNLLTVIILILVLLFLSLPIISFLDLSKGDVLTMGKVYRIGVSLLLVFISFGWSIGYFSQKPVALHSEKPISDSIKQSLDNSFTYAVRQLKKTDSRTSDKIELHELLTADKKGDVTNLQTDLYSIKADSLDYSFINISHRRYFQYFFKNSDKNQKELYLERIFSQKDGKPEQIISMKSTSEEIGVITFNLQDKIKLSSERRFLLVKSEGEVIYSSNKFEFLFPNIKPALSSEKWDEFQSIIKNNKSDLDQEWQLGVHLNGQEYLALISRFSLDSQEEDLWYIYLVNKNVYHAQAGIVSLESLFWILVYLLVLVIIAGFQRLFKKRGHGNWQRFSYQWLFPQQNSGGKYCRGVKFFGYLIILYVGFAAFLTVFNFELSLLQNLILCLLIPMISVVWMTSIIKPKAPHYSRTKFNAYPLFIFCWLMAIGFLPAYWITHVIYSYEQKVWISSLEQDTKELSEGSGARSSAYLTQRSKAFIGVVDAFDPQLKNFIFPNYKEFVDALGNIKFKLFESFRSRLGVAPALLAMLLIVGISFGLYFLLRLLLTRIYWLDLELKGENAFASIVHKDFSKTKKLKLFLCGCDSSEIRYWIHSNMRVNKAEIAFFDCAEKEISFPKHGLHLEGKKIFLIENLHCLPDLGQKFLEILPKYLSECSSIHLIISSGIAWRKLAGNLSSSNQKIKLSELMSGFYFEYVPLRCERDCDGIYDNNFDERELEILLKKGGLFFDKKDKYQRVLLQRYGKAYFYNIWSELSLEEQAICYSFSKEGFLNYTNNDEVTELCQKGVIVRDSSSGKLHLFSQTFRYFILANTSEMMLSSIQSYQKSNSNSGNTQWAILSFLLVAIGLLAYFERTFLTEIQALVTSASGVVSLLFNEIRKYFIKRE